MKKEQNQFSHPNSSNTNQFLSNQDLLSHTESIIAYSDDEEILKHASISYSIMEAISAGDLEALEQYKSISHFQNISHYEVGDSIRKVKNLTLTMNTLACHAAEEGSAPIVYVRTISAAFAQKIESATDIPLINNIRNNLLDFYCNTVHESNLKNCDAISKKCYSYILAHLSEDISMKHCAEYCSISYEYLSRTIKKNFHCSYSALVHQLRIKRACVYLHSSKKITDIAECVGYKSSSQFCHAFLKYTGKPPREWRNDSISSYM